MIFGIDADIFVGMVILWIFSAAVQAMLPPDEASSKGYRFLYNFVQNLASNNLAFMRKVVEYRMNGKSNGNGNNPRSDS